MEIKISQELNAIISYARQEAMRTGNYTIRPDHLYLGLLRQRYNEAYDALKSLGADPDELKRYIDDRIFTTETISYAEIDHINFSRNAQNVLSFTILEASRASCHIATPRHLLLALAMDPGSVGTTYLRNIGVDYPTIAEYMRQQAFTEDDTADANEDGDVTDNEGREEGHEGGHRPRPGRETKDGKREKASYLEEFGYDITKAAAEGKLDPTVGREDEIDRVLQILGRRRKNNPMLVGDSGVGKTAIVEGIATRIASGQVPSDLLGKRIISLDIAAIVAGTHYRGDFEKRLKAILKELTDNPDTILFLDEFHTLIGAGAAEGSLDAANMLKPSLARGEIRCIGATTFDEFSKFVEKDKALDRRFQKVPVMPTGVEQTISILGNICGNYEKHHGVKYTAKAIEDCVKMSERYITDRCLPDKAIDILDEAGSMVHLRHSSDKDGSPTPAVTRADIATVVSKMTGVPLGNVMETEGTRLLNMAAVLKSKVIGQDDAVDTLSRAIRRNRAGIKDPRKPIGAFLFVGPTGVGKTLLAKALAEYLFDSEDNLIRIDMSEYMEKINVSRLIGAPPGYVGYNEGGQLSENVRRKPYSVVLLDEIEKASPEVFNILLQVLDEGRLTDGTGRHVDFRNTVIIMTSNAGSREADEYGKGLGFTTSVSDASATKRAIIDKNLRRIFPPEFLGRIDETIFFNSLTKEDMYKIIDIELKDLAQRLSESGMKLRITPAAKKLIVSSDYNPKFGARPLKRAIRQYVEDPVSEFIITHGLLSGKGGGPITLKVGLSPDRRSTCVLSGPEIADAPAAESAEDEVQKALGELYVDNFEAHIVDHVDEGAK
ncbi:MAG: ATP-dependent Clp protease ATP-binding subunit [Bacteroidales bacterium]|nr:ATP-dependent Clp protease ATP-binding subunit [Bacteroidales bacterium]